MDESEETEDGKCEDEEEDPEDDVDNDQEGYMQYDESYGVTLGSFHRTIIQMREVVRTIMRRRMRRSNTNLTMVMRRNKSKRGLYTTTAHISIHTTNT